MPLPRFEVVTGTINGVNTTFFTSVPYLAGTLAAFLNGQLKRADLDDGWIETNPSIGAFDYKEPPVTDDVVQAFYLDTSAALPQEEVFGLRGVFRSIESRTGTLDDIDELSGRVTLCDD